MMGPDMKRRDAMKLLLATAAASALASCGNTQGDENLAKIVDGKFLTAGEMALLSALAQTIIPNTESPGAIEAGVPETIEGLLSGWGDDKVRVHWRSGLRSLAKQLGNRKGADGFLDMSETARFERLQVFDEGVFGEKIKNDFYKDFKQTIATAYYMSEAGATQELLYDPVPGDFKGCIPFDDVGKAWAT